jgi:uncharacterized protein (UPF0147 family)
MKSTYKHKGKEIAMSQEMITARIIALDESMPRNTRALAIQAYNQALDRNNERIDNNGTNKR